jgi:hypothetical protein
VVEREDHGGSAVAELQLGEEMVDVCLDGSLADEQSAGNLGIGSALTDQGQDLTLAGGQAAEQGGGRAPRRGRR